MPKKVSPEFREAYRKVLTEAAGNPAFRQALLSKNKKTAVSKITEFLGDPTMGKKIANSIYSGPSKYRKLKADTKNVIKLMAYVFGNLPLPSPQEVGAKAPLRAGLNAPATECFELGEDWERM